MITKASLLALGLVSSTSLCAASITTDAPGWTFTDAEAPVFKLENCHKPPLSTNDTNANQRGGAPGGRALPKTETNDTNANLRVFVSSCETIRAWVVRDWRGREVCAGETAPDGTIRLAPLPPGYYRGECGGEKFTFCVVTTNRCRSADSFFAADSALSGCTSTTPAEPRSANRSSRHTRVSGTWQRSSSCGSRAGSRQGRRKT